MSTLILRRPENLSPKKPPTTDLGEKFDTQTERQVAQVRHGEHHFSPDWMDWFPQDSNNKNLKRGTKPAFKEEMFSLSKKLTWNLNMDPWKRMEKERSF